MGYIDIKITKALCTVVIVLLRWCRRPDPNRHSQRSLDFEEWEGHDTMW